MARVTVSFNVDNEAYNVDEGLLDYDEDREHSTLDFDAIADTIKRVALSVTSGRTSGSIFDANGNRVGDWTLEQ